MDDQIQCPFCKKTFPVTEALKHQIREEVKTTFEKEQKQQMWQKALAIAEVKTREASSQELKLLKSEVEEKNKKLEDARENEIALRKDRLRLEEEKKEVELKTQRKLDEEREKITQEAYKKASEENRLKNLEYEKKEQGLLNQIEILKQRAQQGSQEMQGEVIEEEFEKILKEQFPYDEIQEVPKGVTGPDLIQIIKNNFNRECGTIVWEFKNVKNWQEGWISKLREDQRKLKADIGVIITKVLPANVKNFTQINGIWIGSFSTINELGLILRNLLIEISVVKSSEIGKQEKKELLWNYTKSIEFRHRLEAIKDAMDLARDNLEKEKEYFRRKWARDDKSLTLLSENLLGMHGDLQAIVGKSLPEITGLKMLPEEKQENKSEEKNSLF